MVVQVSAQGHHVSTVSGCCSFRPIRFEDVQFPRCRNNWEVDNRHNVVRVVAVDHARPELIVHLPDVVVKTGLARASRFRAHVVDFGCTGAPDRARPWLAVDDAEFEAEVRRVG
jgi:hypothetical protein